MPLAPASAAPVSPAVAAAAGAAPAPPGTPGAAAKPAAPSDAAAGAGDTVLAVSHLSKVYASGHKALDDVSLTIRRGEIFALLGPNGAGKTTLIGIVCGTVRASGGQVAVDGFDHVRDWRACRQRIGLVPQELTTDAFETVEHTAAFSRGLFGLAPDPAHIERTLRALSLWDKRAQPVKALSGGMKRRLLIAKALSHAPRLLFLDEPTAGVDVGLRREMWALVRTLRDDGVTVILTTHYIEEAEEMADRIGVIRQGRLILVEDKARLMRQLGRKQLVLTLAAPLAAPPPALADEDLQLSADGLELTYTYAAAPGPGTAAAAGSDALGRFMQRFTATGIAYSDLRTRQSSLEDIFVGLLERTA